MFYAIMTTAGEGGVPHKKPETPPTVPGEPLRVSENATLLAFANQPDRVFARRTASAYGKILWDVSEEIIHPDDLPADEVFDSYEEFQAWLTRRDMESKVGDSL